MSRPHDKKLVILERRREVAGLCLRGLSQGEIAQRLGISPMTVSRDLEACRKQWRELQDRDIRDRQAEELAKIDHLERNAWEAWERSCQDAETVHVKQETDGSKEEASGKPVATKTVREKTTKKQAGDPRFLQRVGWCIEKRCEILGLDAPKKQEHTGPASKPIEFIIVPSCGPDDLPDDTDATIDAA